MTIMSSGLLPEPRTHDGLRDRRAQRPGQPGEPVRANGAGACSRCHRRGLIYSLCSAVLLLAALGCWAASAWAEQLKPFDWYAVAVRLVYTFVRLGNCPKIADSVAVCLALLLWLEEPQPRAAENSTAERSDCRWEQPRIVQSRAAQPWLDFGPFPYLWENTKMIREAGRGVSRPYLRDPVFS